ncbi:MAG: DUF4097 family beta strand repeat protein [Tissierellia bacterium]|nr:DUF4097 family beta strand repeat protein [Tissierellia bacterium]
MDNKRMILEMLREGKITTEEAQQLLEAIDKKDESEGPKNSTKFGAKSGERFDFTFDTDEIKEKFSDMGKKLENATNINSEDIKVFGQNLGETLLGLGKELESAFSDMVGGFKDYSTTLRKNNESITSNHSLDISDVENPQIDFKAINGGISLKENTEDDLVKIKVKASYKSQEIETGDSLYDFYLEGSSLVFSPKYTNVNIDIEAMLPGKEFGLVTLATKNGRVSVENLNIDSLGVETQNGSIRLVETNINQANLKTQNAAIEVKYTNIEELIANTNNGRILLDAISAQNLDLKTSNGKFYLTGVKAETTVLKTSNASVNVDAIETEKLLVKTSNGRIELSNYNQETMKEIDLTTSNASINVDRLPEEKAVSLDLETSMGNIQVNKDKLIYIKNQHANYGMKRVLAESIDYENAESKLQIKATSSNGSIKIG